ncbi:proteoglycan 4-like [Perognathus longimembris pacificus]|uniref:proteoglycan 4-like n=1 Tax=Perognathus longimembris pacificus TaxID=214514 RepID=UPI002018CA10|nr:proteoglycan 4-like [Perognathus longimembris pacificus]
MDPQVCKVGTLGRGDRLRPGREEGQQLRRSQGPLPSRRTRADGRSEPGALASGCGAPEGSVLPAEPRSAGAGRRAQSEQETSRKQDVEAGAADTARRRDPRSTPGFPVSPRLLRRPPVPARGLPSTADTGTLTTDPGRAYARVLQRRARLTPRLRCPEARGEEAGGREARGERPAQDRRPRGTPEGSVHASSAPDVTGWRCDWGGGAPGLPHPVSTSHGPGAKPEVGRHGPPRPGPEENRPASSRPVPATLSRPIPSPYTGCGSGFGAPVSVRGTNQESPPPTIPPREPTATIPPREPTATTPPREFTCHHSTKRAHCHHSSKRAHCHYSTKRAHCHYSTKRAHLPLFHQESPLPLFHQESPPATTPPREPTATTRGTGFSSPPDPSASTAPLASRTLRPRAQGITGDSPRVCARFGEAPPGPSEARPPPAPAPHQALPPPRRSAPATQPPAVRRSRRRQSSGRIDACCSPSPAARLPSRFPCHPAARSGAAPLRSPPSTQHPSGAAPLRSSPSTQHPASKWSRSPAVTTQHPAPERSRSPAVTTQHPAPSTTPERSRSPAVTTQHPAPSTQHPSRAAPLRLPPSTAPERSRSPAVTTQHPAPSTQHPSGAAPLRSPPSTQHPAPKWSRSPAVTTQHPAPSTQVEPLPCGHHPAPSTQHPSGAAPLRSPPSTQHPSGAAPLRLPPSTAPVPGGLCSALPG